MTRPFAAILAAGAALAALPALAHHSFAMFDQTKQMTLDGTVREFQWTNPHAFIELDVTAGGKTQRWAIELNSPNNLKRRDGNGPRSRPANTSASASPRCATAGMAGCSST